MENYFCNFRKEGRNMLKNIIGMKCYLFIYYQDSSIEQKIRQKATCGYNNFEKNHQETISKYFQVIFFFFLPLFHQND